MHCKQFTRLGNPVKHPCTHRVHVCVCVCVSTPVSKGSTLQFPLFTQGRVAFLSYHTQRSCGQEGEAGTDHPCVPAELLTTLSNLLCLIPWLFMLPPPNLFPTADLQPLCSRACVSDHFFSATANIVLTILFSPIFSPCCCLTFFHLGIELTENQCQSVSRSAVPLGCWV